MTEELKSCQKILKEIIQDKTDEEDFNINLNNLNTSSKQVKQNMKQNIITKINSFTKKFKLNQELYNNKYQDFALEEEANKSFSIRKNDEEDMKNSKSVIKYWKNWRKVVIKK